MALFKKMTARVLALQFIMKDFQLPSFLVSFNPERKMIITF